MYCFTCDQNFQSNRGYRKHHSQNKNHEMVHHAQYSKDKPEGERKGQLKRQIRTREQMLFRNQFGTTRRWADMNEIGFCCSWYCCSESVYLDTTNNTLWQIDHGRQRKPTWHQVVQ